MPTTDDRIEEAFDLYDERYEFENPEEQYDRAVELADEFIHDAQLNPELWSEGITPEYMDEFESREPTEFEPAIEGLFNIGADFGGVEEIKEFENDKLYIPSSHWCALKCINKALEIAKPATPQLPYDLPRFGNTTNGIYGAIKASGIDETLVPRLMKWRAGKWARVSNSKQKIHNESMAILLVHLGRSNFHAVLLKPAGFTKLANGVMSFQTFNETQLQNTCISLKFENKTLDVTMAKLKPSVVKAPNAVMFAYDIETSADYQDLADRPIKRGTLTPEGAAIQRVEYKENGEHFRGPILRFVGSDCLDQMITHLQENEKDLTDIYLYAHNGGKFDHLFMKRSRALRFTKQIKGAGIKNLDAVFVCEEDLPEAQRRTIHCRDSLLFTQASLKTCAKMLKVPEKMDFDIVDKTHEWFVAHSSEWGPYLDQDVDTLACVLLKFEEHMRALGEFMNNNLGLPGIAWRVMRKSCHYLGNQYVPASPVLSKFMRDGCIGGRVIQWRVDVPQEFKNGVIALDGNSLYPSAMYIGQYPVGKPKLLKHNTVDEVLELVSRGQLFEVEILVDAGNVRRPIVPMKTPERSLMYPAGQFAGVYYSPDVTEMLSMGYKILEVRRGIYWAKSERIFEHLIKGLFDMRRKYQKEGNPLQYTIKILLNSLYGKWLEQIKNRQSFKREGQEVQKTAKSNITQVKTLSNGQQEITRAPNHIHDTKPIYIGGFILAYARAIMNNLIRRVGTENICYMDTDSIYVNVDVLEEKKAELAPILHNELCGFKNDYGEGVIVDHQSIFLDLKRYYIHFSKVHDKTTYKAKFTGLNFRCKDLFKNFVGPEDADGRDQTTGTWSEQIVRKMYQEFAEHTLAIRAGTAKCACGGGDVNEAPESCIYGKKLLQEKWGRLVDNVFIDKTEMLYTVGPDKRANWKGTEFYPIGYQHGIPERVLPALPKETMIDKLERLHSKHYDVNIDRLDMALPLRATDMKPRTISREVMKNSPKVLNKGFSTSFIIDTTGVLHKRVIERKQNDAGTWEDQPPRYFSMSPFGLFKPAELKDEDVKSFVITVDVKDGIFPLIDATAVNALMTQIQAALQASRDEEYEDVTD